MKKLTTLLLLLLASTTFGQSLNSLWKEVKAVPQQSNMRVQPTHAVSYELDRNNITGILTNLPEDQERAQSIDLPVGNGSFRAFRIWQTPMMAKGLSDRYPNIHTFTAIAEDNPHVTAKLDLTPDGFHAIIFDGEHTTYINPVDVNNTNFYQCFYKSDVPFSGQWTCGLNDDSGRAKKPGELLRQHSSEMKNLYRVNGSLHKTYRLAVACNYEYSVAVAGPSPTKADVLSKIVTTVNRVNGVYEQEFAISLQLVANEDSIIFNTSTNNPYSNNFPVVMLMQNQATIDMKIGPDNYDIGHVFSTGGGGLANLGCVCKQNQKAQGVTGQPNPVGDPYDIDFVAHEMGHQFGADHTFNANTGSCAGNGVPDHAFEPGSGSTILAYAGICGPDNNLQPHSDPYFHAISLRDINTYITIDSGNICPVTAPSGISPVTIPSFSAQYFIPLKTPFEITAPAVSSQNGDVRYCWEEADLGDFGLSFEQTQLAGPIFRSFLPDTSRTRIFPTISKLVQNITNYIGEKLPDTARVLDFGLTVRNTSGGLGCFNVSDDSIKLNVVQTPGPFAITSQNNPALEWYGGTIQQITWDVANTNLPPINCISVAIFVSIDSGYTFSYFAGNFANVGSALIVVPNGDNSNKARVKIKAVDNVFFSFNPQPFILKHNNRLPWPTGVAQVVPLNTKLNVFPVPAKDVVHVVASQLADAGLKVFNVIGQIVWKGSMTEEATINVSNWARGVYYIDVTSADGKEHAVKPVVIQ